MRRRVAFILAIAGALALIRPRTKAKPERFQRRDVFHRRQLEPRRSRVSTTLTERVPSVGRIARRPPPLPRERERPPSIASTAEAPKPHLPETLEKPPLLSPLDIRGYAGLPDTRAPADSVPPPRTR